MTPPEKDTRPSLLRRLTAMFYDAFLVIALVAAVNALALGITVKLSGGAQQQLEPYLVQLLTVFSIVGFFTLFWRKTGQTLGMQAWRIKLVSFNGETPTTVQGLRRCLAATFSAACLGLGYLWCLVDRRGRYWHDYLSGTELLLLPKPAKKSPV